MNEDTIFVLFRTFRVQYFQSFLLTYKSDCTSSTLAECPFVLFLFCCFAVSLWALAKTTKTKIAKNVNAGKYQ
jgi:hypothetical protein